jgi:multidrug efflux pump subunit AcrA (membrane-fusion protein)
MKKTILLLCAIFFGSMLAACSLINPAPAPTATPPLSAAENRVIAEGSLVPAEFRYLAFSRGGTVQEILVHSGDEVQAGQVLARLGDREQFEASLAGAQLERLNTQQTLDSLVRTADLAAAQDRAALLSTQTGLIAAQRAWNQIDNEAFTKRLDDAEIKVGDARQDLEDALVEFEKYKDLDADNPTRQRAEDDRDRFQAAYDEAVRVRDELRLQSAQAAATLQQAELALAEAQHQVSLTAEGPNTEQLALLEGRLRTAEAQEAAAQAGLDSLELKAPFAGQIVDINVVVNEQIGATTWAFLLADFSEWYIDTTDLTELDVIRISDGQAASVSPDAIEELSLAAEVVEIAGSARFQGGDVLYTVRLRLLEAEPRLRWGMTMEVTFTP